jgi:competence protein ComEA
MKSNIVMIVVISAGQLLFASGAFATAARLDESKVAKPNAAASATASAKKKGQPSIKPVDINSASKAELMKLPGLSAADAERVIAGRPYLSKAHLVTHKVISESQYQAITSMIMARQKGVPVPKTAEKK